MFQLQRYYDLQYFCLLIQSADIICLNVLQIQQPSLMITVGKDPVIPLEVSKNMEQWVIIHPSVLVVIVLLMNGKKN